MPTPKDCRRCGLPLDEGICARCLLELGVGQTAAEDEPAASAPAVKFVPPTVEELAPLFPDLEIGALIGHGGMGAVFRARQRKLERDVALKVLPRELSADRAFAERFLREARALARLSHPNIVAVHDYGETGGVCWLLLEYVDGANLRAVLREGRMESRTALALVKELCDALQYAHDEGVVHRDIKPENVLVDRRGRAKVADFGLAKLVGPAQGADLTREGQVMGTPHYMAPEQIERPREVDHRADIYALGVVLYEMLTGSLPRGKFEPPSRRVQVDVRLDEIVLKALEHEPARRYQHAVDVKTDVDAVGDGSPRSPEPEVVAGFGIQAGIDERGVFVERLAAQDDPPLRGADAAASSRDVLRGWRGFAFTVLVWIGVAAAWNLGAFAYGLALVAAATLYAARLRSRLCDEPALAAELSAERPAQRAARIAGAASVAIVGLALVSIGHVAHWERSVTQWAPAYRGADAAMSAVRGSVWSLVRGSSRAEPGVEPRLATLGAEWTGGIVDALPIAPLWVVCAGLVVLGSAVYVAIRPARASRAAAGRVATEQGVLVAGAVVLLWVSAPLAALRHESTLESVHRVFEADVAVADPADDASQRTGRPFGEAERRLRRALVAQGLRADHVQVAQVSDARSGAHHADVLVVRGAADSPFDRWSTSWNGARRTSPQVWITATRVADADRTQFRAAAGLYPPGSPEATVAERVLAAIAAEVNVAE